MCSVIMIADGLKLQMFLSSATRFNDDVLLASEARQRWSNKTCIQMSLEAPIAQHQILQIF